MTTLPTPRIPDPMDAPPLRWGILGTGWIAERFIDTLHKNTRQRLVAVGSRTESRGKRFADRFEAERAYGSYEALVEDADVDIVYVATPHSEHRDNALMAIEAGKPVLVEKAFARTFAEANEIVEAAGAAGVALMEAMWTRFLPHMDVVRQLLEVGALGEIETVFADHGQWFEQNESSRLFAPELAGGAMLDLGVYPVSFVNFVLGAPALAAALGSRAFTGVDRQISAVLGEFPDHPHAQALISTTLAARTPTVAHISGDKARIEIPGPFYGPGQISFITRDGEVAVSERPQIEDHGGLCYEAAHFATMVAEGRTESELMPHDDTLAVMATMDELVEEGLA
ncbi:Gfo/Idh/MocA family protein [Tessaracoccus flavus]|uniref:Oxidoreductase n=1 Tax=Tessaracoccus flavus TaxID=1610493 RepID=A0A1Q2CBW8_9ACTN|nr:Gfo/Idh/MocA family oxidoreductase [Tessaracoccus flavus]AQP43613.1 oxidoreductase [Tessaracoccus flavus]SDZ00900.1 Predicted dehydrogenase [Tessaracoccus flavus]